MIMAAKEMEIIQTMAMATIEVAKAGSKEYRKSVVKLIHMSWWTRPT